MASGEVNLVWLQGGGCTGCSVSLLNSVHPSVRDLVLGPLLPGVHLSLQYHPTLMAGQGAPAARVLEELPDGGYVLVLEGAVPDGDGFCELATSSGREVALEDRFVDLARQAELVLAVGTCASFGGIPASAPNPARYRSAGEVLSKRGVPTPVVNVPGCPPHPDWMSSTLVAYVLAERDASAIPLDVLGRPLSVYGHLIHENCPRRAYFDEGKFAAKPGDPECLHKVGCKGPITYADCPLREWNASLNWCVKAGAPCQGCTQPEFIDLTTPVYVELAEDRMPKIGETGAGGAHE